MEQIEYRYCSRLKGIFAAFGGFELVLADFRYDYPAESIKSFGI